MGKLPPKRSAAVKEEIKRVESTSDEVNRLKDPALKFDTQLKMLRIVTLFGVFVLLEIFLSFNAVLGLQTMFNGSQYIAYPMQNEEGSFGDRIVLDFKTSEPYGVLLYSGGTQKDFVAVEIIRGKLRYSLALFHVSRNLVSSNSLNETFPYTQP